MTQPPNVNPSDRRQSPGSDSQGAGPSESRQHVFHLQMQYIIARITRTDQQPRAGGSPVWLAPGRMTRPGSAAANTWTNGRLKEGMEGKELDHGPEWMDNR